MLIALKGHFFAFGKRLLSYLMALILICVFVFPAAAEQRDVASKEEEHICGDFTYIILNDGTAEIIRYTGQAEELTIPDELDGLTVTGIGNLAFQDCSFLTEVTISSSIISIGTHTFLDLDCFFFISRDSYAELYCQLKEYSYDYVGVQSSGEYRYIILDDGTVEIIGYTGQAEKLKIPGKLDGLIVTSIGDLAFEWDALISVTIPDSVISIGDNPFKGCENLKDINISPNHPYLAMIDGVLFSKPDSRLIYYPVNLSSEPYSIPDGTQVIGGSAFYDYTATSITIPASVTSIGNYAFERCGSLASITIPESVMRIDDSVFSECSALTTIIIPDSVTRIGETAFFGCDSLITITIPDSVMNMGDNPFKGCENLKKINVSPDHPYLATIDGVLFSKPENRLICYPAALPFDHYSIPDGILSIDRSAFYDCQSLTAITLPDSITSIGDEAFLLCESLTAITIPDSVSNIGENAFGSCCSLTDITIPNGVTRIEDSVFADCSALTTITIPDSVVRIDGYAFLGCDSLSTINIPENVISIGDWAFCDCSSLTSVTIPNSVTSIGEKAFCNCSSLTTITIPPSVTGIGFAAFEMEMEESRSLMFIVSAGSYAEQYCIDNEYSYRYPGELGTVLFSHIVSFPALMQSIDTQSLHQQLILPSGQSLSWGRPPATYLLSGAQAAAP